MTDEKTYYPWEAPDSPEKARVWLLNSFTGKKEPFVPHDESNRVTWYVCGPTVYDSAHIGHASNYMRFDIVRRILSDYFGYDVVTQMNVTDIDDKIIKRANERNIPFDELSGEFEKEFLEDMDSLNVLRPDYVTRVSEYIPEVIEYIERIIKNGFAYESSGSVYFDKTAFIDAGHNYGKLEPWSVGNKALLTEGEGVLTAADEEFKQQKKSSGDFVLWKKSKENEPWWDSPWGHGRPGWHIECSAMASNVLGQVIDIHAGGVDLRFPHHSNEIAQAEAYHCCSQWVNYFLHSGHLHIEGRKMSKSLKNFITIRECLKRYNARQIRLAFLGHRYDAPMNYAEHGMEEAVNLDRSFADFYGDLKATLRELARVDIKQRVLRPGNDEMELSAEVQRRQDKIDNYLRDNLNTPGALLEVQGLVRSTNAYMKAKGAMANAPVLETVGRYVTKVLRVFGVTGTGIGDIGYGDGDGGEAVSRENIIAPVLESFSQFRDSVRRAARSEKSEATLEILQLCDRMRDEILPEVGVRLEDRGGDQAAVWKLEDRETLLMELRRKREAENKRRAEVERQKAERAAKAAAELEKGRVAPEQLFQQGEYKGLYSEYDNSGIPTKDKDGNELSKSAVKTLTKARARQVKLHTKFLKAQQAAVPYQKDRLAQPAEAV